MMQTILSWFKREDAKVEPFYRSREVWTYTHVDPRTRRTSTRAVLVYRKASDGMFWGLPLMKANVRGKTIYVPRQRSGTKVSALAQMRTLKASRLVNKLGTAGEKEFGALHNSIVRLLAEAAPVKKKPRVVQRPRIERSVPSPIYILQPRSV